MKKTIMFLGMLSLGLAQAQQNDPYEGKVGVNTETPSATLNVKSKTGTTASTKNFELQNASDKKLVTVLDDGKTGIGTDTPEQILHTKGNILADGAIVSRRSDAVGGYLVLDNPTKSGEKVAKRWVIYNMSNQGYSNSLQFWPYDTSGHDYFIGSAVTFNDNGNIGIRNMKPTETFDTWGAIKIGTAYSTSTITDGAKTPVPNGSKGTIIYQNGHFFGWVDDTNGWKQLDNEKSTGATQLPGTEGIVCNEGNRGKMNFKKGESDKSDVFGVCLKHKDGSYNWAYLVGGNNHFEGTRAFGNGLQ